MAASLGATAYSSVTWTSGDIITEAKMDAMVGNDQAYDSHSAQGYLADNNKSFASKNATATANLNLIKMTSGDVIQIGDSGTTYNVIKISSAVIQVTAGHVGLSTGDGKAYFSVPEELNGLNLVSCYARVVTAGTTGTTDIQIRNVTDSQDMLSTKLTIDSGENGSDTAATAAVVDTDHDDVATNDLIAIDIDAVSTTAPQGLVVRLRFGLP